MNIYIADDGDTLRKVSRIKGIDIKELMYLNPNITSPDANITGRHVKVPESSKSTRRQNSVPQCPEPILAYQEQWIPLTSLEQMENTDYDVLVVGTGAGGGAALWRLVNQLRNSGKRIGVIERGGLLIPTHAQNIATLDFESRNSYFNSVAIRRTDFGTQLVYALGGRTLFWTATSPRMHVSEIARWGIPVKEMELYYKIAEKAMNITQSFTKGASITQILLKRLQQNGFPESMDEPIAMNLQPTAQFGTINSNVFFSTIELFAEALKGYDLAVNARAVEVLVENGEAAGVKVMSPDKRTYYLKAKNVVVAASVIGTTQILLNSEIQGRAIGHYLTNHSRVIGTGMVSRNKFPEVLGPLRILIPGTETRPHQLQILGPGPYRYVQFEQVPLRAEWSVTFAASGRVESRYDNRITLDPLKRDEYGIPEVQIHFSYSEQDRAVIEQMKDNIEKASSVLNAPLISLDSEQLVCLVTPGQEVHEMGTCRMGDDPMSSVTNRYGQIHGVKGLYVADNSVIPTSGTASPTLTTVALAIRTADYIAQQLK